MELDLVLSSNSISTGCSELLGSGLWWSKPECQRCYNKCLKNNEIVLLENLLVHLITLCSAHRVLKAKRDVRPSHATAKQGPDPRFMAPSPLCCLPQTGREVRSKRGDLNLFQVLNLRASTLFADADRVSQPDSILSKDFCLHTLSFYLIHGQALTASLSQKHIPCTFTFGA